MQADSRLDTQDFLDLNLYLNKRAILSSTLLILPTCKKLLWPLENPSLLLNLLPESQENVFGTQDTTFGYLEIVWTSVKIPNLWTSWPTQFALTMLTNVQLHLVVFHGKLMTLIVEQKVMMIMEKGLISMPSTTDLPANVPNGNSFRQVNPA